MSVIVSSLHSECSPEVKDKAPRLWWPRHDGTRGQLSRSCLCAYIFCHSHSSRDCRVENTIAWPLAGLQRDQEKCGSELTTVG